MNDLISRKAAIYAFEDTTFTKNEIRRRLSEVPPTEPKKGKWIQKYPNSSWFECSECGVTCLGGLKSGKLFCTNCGADMRETYGKD